MSEEKGNWAVERMWGCGSHHLPPRHQTLTTAISRLNLKKHWRGAKPVKKCSGWRSMSATEPRFNPDSLPISIVYGSVLVQQQNKTGWCREEREFGGAKYNCWPKQVWHLTILVIFGEKYKLWQLEPTNALIFIPITVMSQHNTTQHTIRCTFRALLAHQGAKNCTQRHSVTCVW